VGSADETTLGQMLGLRLPVRLPHRHRAVRARVVVRRSGVPYELERTVCSGCAQVLSERAVGRPAT
jgi:hypothetical protein